MAEWISVNERLPKRNERVVVSDGKHTWDCGAFQGIGFSDGNPTKWNWKHNTVKNVLWWIPKKDALPKPPGGDGMNNCTGEKCIMNWNAVEPATCKAVGYCPQATPPKTNADRIRAMSDEELAGKFALSADCPPKKIKCYPKSRNCKKCWLDWLREPVGGAE